MKNKHRTDRFKKNQKVENILQLLDKNLRSVEKKLIREYTTSDYPTIFIFGCARSGTTLLHQYVSQNLKCIYPTNFISRFYYAPYLGGLYYKLFTDLDDRGELLGGPERDVDDFFSSDLGKTEGIHSPNEFWYFWRKHFPINNQRTIDRQKIDSQKAIFFRNSIFALQNLYDGPFIMKGMIANNCIDMLSELFPKAVFLFIRRDLFANAKSLYKARLDYFDTPKQWYSFYPKEKEVYQDLSPEEQVVRQVLDTNDQILQSLNMCNNKRTIKLDYEPFCKAPKTVLELLKNTDESIQVNADPVPSKFTIREKKGLEGQADTAIKSVIKNLET